MARRHDVLHAQAVHIWCPHARDRCCACKSAARKLRRSSASRAASRLVVLCGRRAAWAWSGSTTFGSARCRSLRELKRIVPWPLWLGRVRGHSGPSIACMRGRCIILMHYRKDVSHPGLDRTRFRSRPRKRFSWAVGNDLDGKVGLRKSKAAVIRGI